MAALSVVHRAALAQLVDAVPDGALRQLTLMVAGMSGERARGLETVLDEAALDRARRARAMAALTPLFRPRSDGVAAMTFPAGVLTRLWRIASQGQTAFLPLLDDDDDRQLPRISALSVRIFQAAAAAVRDQPDAVWPRGKGDPAAREAALVELAHCCDLGALLQRALPSLQAWVGRPGADQLAELRLLIRDSASMAPDGAKRLLDVLFAHLDDAALILRLVVHASGAAQHESFLRESELAVFVERLLDAIEVRLVRTTRFQPDQPLDGLTADLQWMAETLTELDTTLNLQPDSVWGRRTHDARRRVSDKLTVLLNGVEKSVDRALPMERVRTAGRMTRAAPDLGAPLDPAVRANAERAMALVAALRHLAGPFACEARRWELVEALKARLVDYADLTLEEINAGDVADEPAALDRVNLTARFLMQIEARPEARAVRRRVAVAGEPPVHAKASPTAI